MKKYLHTTHRNIAWINHAHENNELKMNPPFQRKPVWTDQQKSFLIDTILNEFPIPEIYMQEVISSQGKAEYIIVDGQQRIRACLDFINNIYTINGKDSPKWADMGFEELSSEEKKKIFEYDFVVRILPEMSDTEIREIFTRLNRNTVALNSQELRQATYWGEFISTINELADDEVWNDTGVFTQNDFRRMVDAEYISELVIGHLHGPQNKKLTLDKYYQLYEQEFDEKGEIKKIFLKVVNEILEVLPEIKKTRWRKKTDFYTLFLEFANYNFSVPLSSEKRILAHEELIQFGAEVDDYVKTPEDTSEQQDFREEVIIYGNAIRAGTDLGNRKRRKEILHKELSKIWE